MIREEIRKNYSCKRKKDFITLFAVCFFLLVVVAELYLVFYVPVQLQREGVLQKHIARENTIKLLDSMRQYLHVLRRTATKTQSQEMLLTSQVLDDYAQYVRGNLDYLSHAEILDLINQIRPYEMMVHKWHLKQFVFKEEAITLQGFYKNIEKKYNMQ